MTFLFTSIAFNSHQNEFWSKAIENASYEGEYYINLSRKLNPNRLISRCDAKWAIPFDQQLWPGYEMPVYDPKFSKTFKDVTDERAVEIKRRIDNGERFGVYYSGGIDSTVILVALLKHLNRKQLKNITLVCNAASIANNSRFWKDHLANKFQVLDSSLHKYDSLIALGLTPITGDTGDCLFGTTFATHFYYNHREFSFNESHDGIKEEYEIDIRDFTSGDVHYSQFKDSLVKYFTVSSDNGFPFANLPSPPENFGEYLYYKMDQHARTAPMQIHSLHDFFWWYIFNLKYLNTAVRGLGYYNDTQNVRKLHDVVVNWYHTDDYQQWSMNNNNNGTKIQLTPASYKKVSRDYIYDYDQDENYYHFKLKIENVGLLYNKQKVNHLPGSFKPNFRFGIDSNYNIVSINEPAVQQEILEAVSRHKE